jgi:glycine C-acetyltransferase
MDPTFLEHLGREMQSLRDEGLFKPERVIASPQQTLIRLEDGREVVNLCANNYLGLADDPRVVAAARDALPLLGYGMASVRFICGTQSVHKRLEARISAFLGTDDTVLYSSCFDANTGLFETLLGPEDAVISDALNHASIIDGVRLCKARRLRYANNDMGELEARLVEAADARFRLIATDGVFSMDGIMADLPTICDLADRHRALVMVDDSHAVGFVGEKGRGTPEACGVQGRVDILTGTLGKALGGASGGYTATRREIAEWLRQRSRPYLFSNALAPVVAAASLAVLDLLERSDDLRLHARAGPASDHSRDDRRREARRADGGAAARRGHLRRRLLLPGRPEGPGPHPHPDVGRPRAHPPRPRTRGLREGGPRGGRPRRLREATVAAPGAGDRSQTRDGLASAGLRGAAWGREIFYLIESE